jgi:hypothetical protein
VVEGGLVGWWVSGSVGCWVDGSVSWGQWVRVSGLVDWWVSKPFEIREPI